jgi:hypothetical protein
MEGFRTIDPADVTSDGPDFSKLIVEFYEDAILDERATNGWTEETFDYQTQTAKTIRHPGAKPHPKSTSRPTSSRSGSPAT